MVKPSNFVSLTGFVVLLAILMLMIKTCTDEPAIAPAKFASTLAVMRSDMRATVAIGGVVADSDDNRKTQINRVSIYTGIRSDSWTRELHDKYVQLLLQHGWVKLAGTGARMTLCKDGALAEVADVPDSVDGTRKNGFVSMAFSSATIVRCAAVKQEK